MNQPSKDIQACHLATALPDGYNERIESYEFHEFMNHTWIIHNWHNNTILKPLWRTQQLNIFEICAADAADAAYAAGSLQRDDVVMLWCCLSSRLPLGNAWMLALNHQSQIKNMVSFPSWVPWANAKRPDFLYMCYICWFLFHWFESFHKTLSKNIVFALLPELGNSSSQKSINLEHRSSPRNQLKHVGTREF